MIFCALFNKCMCAQKACDVVSVIYPRNKICLFILVVVCQMEVRWLVMTLLVTQFDNYHLYINSNQYLYLELNIYPMDCWTLVNTLESQYLRFVGLFLPIDVQSLPQPALLIPISNQSYLFTGGEHENLISAKRKVANQYLLYINKVKNVSTPLLRCPMIYREDILIFYKVYNTIQYNTIAKKQSKYSHHNTNSNTNFMKHN